MSSPAEDNVIRRLRRAVQSASRHNTSSVYPAVTLKRVLSVLKTQADRVATIRRKLESVSKVAGEKRRSEPSTRRSDRSAAQT